MMEHLGGPESPEKLADRQRQYEKPASRQFKIVDNATGRGAGWVGYWERQWQGDRVYETGWAVVPAFQGRGIAGSAVRLLIGAVKAERARRFLHAFPSVGNAASNAICRTAGFTLGGPCDFEYPKGSVMRCHDWRLDLQAGGWR